MAGPTWVFSIHERTRLRCSSTGVHEVDRPVHGALDERTAPYDNAAVTTRRSVLLSAGALVACRKPAMPSVRHKPAAALPSTTLPWLGLKDHFVATVGPSAGQGARLGPLLVLADATFAPRSRFPLHPHREMEILSIVIDGQLSHHGDQAHGMTLGAREAQLISSRDGMLHAEGNDTDTPTRMLQIWFEPTSHGGTPEYFHRTIGAGALQPVAGDEAMPLRADVKVFWSDVRGRQAVEFKPGRRGYLLAMRGQVSVQGGPTLAQGDGAEVGPGQLELRADDAAVLIIDLAG